MQNATQVGDGNRIAELSKSIHRCQGDIEKLYDDLVKFSGIFESQQAVFEEKLKRLDAQKHQDLLGADEKTHSHE
jgi:hypothetical protein